MPVLIGQAQAVLVDKCFEKLSLQTLQDRRDSLILAPNYFTIGPVLTGGQTETIDRVFILVCSS